MNPVREVVSSSEWNGLLTSRQRPSFLQSWEWGELKRRYGWRPVRLAVHEASAPGAGLQMLIKARRPARLLPRVGLAYIPRGPFGEASEAGMDALLARAVATARALGAAFVRMEPPAEEYAAVRAASLAAGFKRTNQYVQLRATAYLDLAPDQTTILAGFKPKTRYNVRLAEKRGVQVRVAASGDDLEPFYRLTVETGARDGFAVHAPRYYEAVWETFGTANARLFLAGHGGQDIAALFAVRCGKMATYLYGASSAAHRNLMPNHLLQWQAVLWAKGQGCTTYDFWGMAAPGEREDAMAGVHRFKAGFNPTPVMHPGTFDLALNVPAYLTIARVAIPARAWLQRLGSGRRGPATAV